MWVQGSEFLYPDVFFLSDVSWVAMFQDGESVILVESVGVGDVVDVVEVDAQGILVIEVVEVHHHATRQLFPIPDVLCPVPVVSVRMVLSCFPCVVLQT